MPTSHTVTADSSTTSEDELCSGPPLGHQPIVDASMYRRTEGPLTPQLTHHRQPMFEADGSRHYHNKRLQQQQQQQQQPQFLHHCNPMPAYSDFDPNFNGHEVVPIVGSTGLAPRPLAGTSTALNWPEQYGECSGPTCIHRWQHQQLLYTMHHHGCPPRFHQPADMPHFPPSTIRPSSVWLEPARDCGRSEDAACSEGCYGYDDDEDVSTSQRCSSTTTSMYPMIGSCCTTSGQHHYGHAAAMMHLSSFLRLSPSQHRQASSSSSWIYDCSGSVDLPEHLRRPCHQCSGSSTSTDCSSAGCVYGGSNQLPPHVSSRHRNMHHQVHTLGSDRSGTVASGSTLTSATVQSAPATLCRLWPTDVVSGPASERDGKPNKPKLLPDDRGLEKLTASKLCGYNGASGFQRCVDRPPYCNQVDQAELCPSEWNTRRPGNRQEWRADVHDLNNRKLGDRRRQVSREHASFSAAPTSRQTTAGQRQPSFDHCRPVLASAQYWV